MINIRKKAIPISITIFTVFVAAIVLVLFKFPSLFAANTCPTTLKQGDLIKVTGFDTSIFTLNSRNQLIYFPSLGVLKSWILVPDNLYQYVDTACLDSLSATVPSQNAGINFKPGSFIVQHNMGTQLYAILPGKKLVPISANTAKFLYGNTKGDYTVAKINYDNWPNYIIDTTTSINYSSESDVRLQPGMIAQISGHDYYVDSNNIVHEITAAGFTANNFQARFRKARSASYIKGMIMGSPINKALPHLLDMTQNTVESYDPSPVMSVLSGTADKTSIALSWNQYSGSGFKSYNLVRSETNQNPKYPTDTTVTSIYKPDTLKYTNTGLKEGTTYYYNLCVEQMNEAVICGTAITVKTLQSLPTPPTTPVLSGTVASDSVNLSWTGCSSTNFKAYHVVRSTTDTTPQYPELSSLTDITNASTVTYSDRTTQASTTYYYGVCAEDTFGQIACSNALTVTTLTPPPPPPPPAYGTIYYIRTDGGTYEQCDGKTNVAYSTSITDKKCAVNHPFWLFPPSGSARIAGGDTVIIANGAYKMGYGAPNTSTCSSYYPWDCVMPKIPSGPSKDKPTRILGADYSSGCVTKPQLWGAERASRIMDLRSSSNVEIQCLEITDRSQCVEFHSGGNSCDRGTYPYGDWAATGLVAADSTSVLLKNLDIHGMANRGVMAARLTDWIVENVKIEGNGWAGWDGDIDGSDSNSGTMTFKKLSIVSNGCGETYPGRQATGCWAQTAGGYGDGFGVGATGGDWLFEDSQFKYNTSDGLDLLYHRLGGTVTVRRTYFEGNAGQAMKIEGKAIATDNVIIGNCGYFAGKSFTHNVDNCRARGNTVSFTFDSYGNSSIFNNNTVYSEGDCLIVAETTSDAGSQNTITARNNILYAGVDYLQPFENSCYIWSNNQNAIIFDNDYSTLYNAKEGDYYQCLDGAHNLCSTNPQFVKVAKDSFDLRLQSTSPAIDRGTTGTGITSIDFLLRTRPQGGGADMGAYEIK